MKILAVGPLKNSTGQSVHFTEVCKNIDFDKIINTKKFRSKFLSNIYSIIQIVLLANKYKVIYFTPSRSRLGCFKDIILISKFQSKKIIAHLHGYDLNDFLIGLTNFERKIIKKKYETISKWIVLENKMINQLKIFKNSNIVVPNFVNISSNEASVGDGILYFSSISKDKGFLDFVWLIENNPNLNYFIAGDISDSKCERELNRILSINRNVKYLRYISDKEKINIFNKIKFHYFPSRYKTEASPLSLIETMNFGIIPIVYNFNCLPDVVPNQQFVFENKEEVQNFVTININKDLNYLQKQVTKYSTSKYDKSSSIEKIHNLIYDQ